MNCVICGRYIPEGTQVCSICSVKIEESPTVLTILPKLDISTIMTALMDLRDEWIAKMPKSEWYKSERAQGIEQGIEMAIEKVRGIGHEYQTDD